MAHKTGLEIITEITLNDAFFLIIERMGLVNSYYLDPNETKTYYDRLIIINKDKPSLNDMEDELLKYKNELLDLEKQKLKILHNKKQGEDHGRKEDW